MRGDRPEQLNEDIAALEFTPHARGSTGSRRPHAGRSSVYPACAGIDLMPGQTQAHPRGLPRMRGDRPCPAYQHGGGPVFTPHARGSTRTRGDLSVESYVYPACAGIDPHVVVLITTSCGLPRMRGDRPRPVCIR